MHTTSRPTATDSYAELPSAPLSEMAEVLGHRYLDFLHGLFREMNGAPEEEGALTLSEHISNFHRDLEGLLQLSSRFSRNPIFLQLLTECLEIRDEFSGFLQDFHQLIASARCGSDLEFEKRELLLRNQRLSAKLDLVTQLAERLELIGSPLFEAA